MIDGGHEVMKLRSTRSTPDYTVSARMCRDAISNCPKNLKYLIHLFKSIYFHMCVCLPVLTLYNDAVYWASVYRFSCKL